MSGNEEQEQHHDNHEVSTDESTKRKEREGDNEGSLFKKSKKTHWTPQKGQQKAEDEKLDQILGLMKDLKGEVSQIRKEQREYWEEIRKLQVENNNLKKENKSIRKENKEIKAELMLYTSRNLSASGKNPASSSVEFPCPINTYRYVSSQWVGAYVPLTLIGQIGINTTETSLSIA